MTTPHDEKSVSLPAIALADHSRRAGHGRRTLPRHRGGAHEANRGDTIVFYAVVFDVQIHPWSQLGLGALKLLLIKKFPAPRHNDHRRDAIAPLAQIGRIAKNMDVVAQQSFVVERHNLRDLAGLRGPALWGRLLGSRLRRDEEHSHQEKHPLFHSDSPCIDKICTRTTATPSALCSGKVKGQRGATSANASIPSLHHRVRSTRKEGSTRFP